MPFDPSTLSPIVWDKAYAGLTLNTTAYAGAGTASQSGTTLTGAGTAFLSEVRVGDTLSAFSGAVTAIASNTSLTVGSAFSDNANDTSPDRGNIETNPWDHLLTLNNNTTIATTTLAVGGISVRAVGAALGFRYNEVFTVGGMYERIRAIPVVLTGTNVRCFIDFGFAGGQR